MKAILQKPNYGDYRLWRPNYGDLIQIPILSTYVYRPYRETLYKDIYICIYVKVVAIPN